MFVVVSRFDVRPGEEDAFLALHEAADIGSPPGTDGLISRELLTDAENPSSFMTLARYRGREAAEMHSHAVEDGDWFQRLVSLSQRAPHVALYRMAWKDA
jgi:quinol monooxygenase YgiN